MIQTVGRERRCSCGAEQGKPKHARQDKRDRHGENKEQTIRIKGTEYEYISCRNSRGITTITTTVIIIIIIIMRTIIITTARATTDD